MTLNSEMLDAMLEADLTREQIVSLVKAAIAKDEAQRAERRMKDAERQRRHRHADSDGVTDCNAESRGHNVTTRDPVDTQSKKEIPPTPPKEKINNISPNARAREAAEILAALEAVLSPEMAAGVIEHRKRIKKPLTLIGAKGLAKRYSRCRDGPDAAAEYHITSGNQGFEPEWYDNAKRTHTDRNGEAAGVLGVIRRLQNDPENSGDAGREPDPDRLRLAAGRGSGA